MSKAEFTDDDINRSRLPRDVFLILHDCAYLYAGCPDWHITNIRERAQKALVIRDSPEPSARAGRSEVDRMKMTPGRAGSFHHGVTLSDDPPKALEAIADVVLAYRPKPKSKAAKRRSAKDERRRSAL